MCTCCDNVRCERLSTLIPDRVAKSCQERLDDAAGALPEMDQDVVSQYEDKIESLETERGNLKEEAEDLDGEEKTRIREKIDLLK